MPGPSGERCDGCYFWERWGDENGVPTEDGICFRMPPGDNGDGEPLRPVTDQVDWCGEFKPKKDEPCTQAQ